MAPRTSKSAAASKAQKPNGIKVNGTDAKSTATKSTKTTKAKVTNANDVTKAAATKVTKTTAAKKTASKAAAPAKKTTKTAAPTTKTASKAKTAKSTPPAESKATTTSKKRRATEEPEEKPVPQKRAKKEPVSPKAAPKKAAQPKATSKKAATAKAAPIPAQKLAPKKGPVINQVPTQVLDIYVCGDGENAELGLGSQKNSVNVKRPRLNALLAADIVGVVDIAVGGMHSLALTKDNKIYSWGVNDQGALGRDTEWKAPEKDVEDTSDSDSEASNAGENLNPKESVPTAIPSDAFPEETVFVKVAAGDSSSWALTDDGHVYGWGTFRSNEGIIGYRKGVHVQPFPVLVPDLKDIVDITCGANHVLAHTSKGKLWVWGNGQQNQLGRRVVERSKLEALVPRELGVARKKIAGIGAGAYHSFAVDDKNNVYAWGLNSFGECGIMVDPENEATTIVSIPTKVPSLVGKNVSQISGGSHHSAAVTTDGKMLVWGRMDGGQLGLGPDAIKALPEDHVVRDTRDQPRILAVPEALPQLGNDAAWATCGSDHTIGISKAGKAYTMGFNANYQCGQGSDDDIEVATMIDNTATRDKKLVWAGAGGQFTVLAGLASKTTS